MIVVKDLQHDLSLCPVRQIRIIKCSQDGQDVPEISSDRIVNAPDLQGRWQFPAIHFS